MEREMKLETVRDKRRLWQLGDTRKSQPTNGSDSRKTENRREKIDSQMVNVRR